MIKTKRWRQNYDLVCWWTVYKCVSFHFPRIRTNGRDWVSTLVPRTTFIQPDLNSIQRVELEFQHPIWQAAETRRGGERSVDRIGEEGKKKNVSIYWGLVMILDDSSHNKNNENFYAFYRQRLRCITWTLYVAVLASHGGNHKAKQINNKYIFFG